MIGRVVNVGKIYGLNSAYEIWNEANNTILNCNDNKEKLNQGFLSLKRAFNVTSMELRKNLGIDNIKYSSKKKTKDFLGDLEYFEIIKTLTLNKYNIYGIILGIQLIFLINLQNILALLAIIIKFYLNIL